MILDNLSGLSAYVALNPLFNEVIEFLKGHDLAALPVGKHKIKGDDVFVNIMDVQGKTPEEARMETHQKMIDIQIPISCAETFGYTPLCNLPDFEYNAEKDITKYGDTMAQTYVTVNPGQMAIFFPQDGHAPCISDDAEIKKAIFKVKK